MFLIMILWWSWLDDCRPVHNRPRPWCTIFITDPLWTLSIMNGSVMNVVCYECCLLWTGLFWNRASSHIHKCTCYSQCTLNACPTGQVSHPDQANIGHYSITVSKFLTISHKHNFNHGRRKEGKRGLAPWILKFDIFQSNFKQKRMFS